MTWLTVVSPPAEEALTLAEAKTFLRIGHDGEDALIASLIAAVRSDYEAATGRCLVTRTLRRHWTRWPAALTRGGCRLTPGAASALISIELVQDDNEAQVVTGRFRLQGPRLMLRPFVMLPAIPSGGHVAITYSAGFGAAAAIPDHIRLTLLNALTRAYARGDSGVPDALEIGEVKL